MALMAILNLWIISALLYWLPQVGRGVIFRVARLTENRSHSITFRLQNALNPTGIRCAPLPPSTF